MLKEGFGLLDSSYFYKLEKSRIIQIHVIGIIDYIVSQGKVTGPFRSID